MLQAALRRLNPKAPELSKEFLEQAYEQAAERGAIDDRKTTTVSSAPALAEMGLGPDGRPLTNPAPARPANEGASDGGGFFGKLGKLMGSGQSETQAEPLDRQARFIEALKKRGVSQDLIIEALQEAG